MRWRRGYLPQSYYDSLKIRALTRLLRQRGGDYSKVEPSHDSFKFIHSWACSGVNLFQPIRVVAVIPFKAPGIQGGAFQRHLGLK